MRRETFPPLTRAQFETLRKADEQWRKAVCRRAWSFTQPDGKEYPQ